MRAPIFRRGSGRRYDTRPSDTCRAAQSAWDYFESRGPIDWLQLVDGWWRCWRVGQAAPDEAECQMFVRGRREWEGPVAT
jgi:hypothetical protein